jgi:NADPH:quinone reductase-like Zn-dependent oxidoreductase
MHAAVLEISGEAPRYGEHPDPVDADGCTLVRMTAAPIVPLDLLCASGTSYFGRPATPYVPGDQGVGVVEQSAVLPVGTRVFVVTAAARVLADGGRLVNIGGAAGDSASFSSAVLRSRTAAVLGYTNNALSAQQRHTALDAVLEHAAAGRLGVAHEILPLSAVADVWQRQATGEATARLVLTP